MLSVGGERLTLCCCATIVRTSSGSTHTLAQAGGASDLMATGSTCTPPAALIMAATAVVSGPAPAVHRTMSPPLALHWRKWTHWRCCWSQLRCQRCRRWQRWRRSRCRAGAAKQPLEASAATLAGAPRQPCALYDSARARASGRCLWSCAAAAPAAAVCFATGQEEVCRQGNSATTVALTTTRRASTAGRGAQPMVHGAQASAHGHQRQRLERHSPRFR